MTNKTFKVTEQDLMFLLEKHYNDGKRDGFMAGYNAASKAAKLSRETKEQNRNLFGKIS